MPTSPESPIILLGSQRSGTTFFANLLSQHPNAAFGNEDGVIRCSIIWFKHLCRTQSAFRAARYYEFVNVINAIRQGPKYDLIKQKVKAIIVNYQRNGKLDNWIQHNDVNAFIRNLSHDYHVMENSKSAFWGDKYPEYLLMLDDMCEIFPNAKFIFMIRHPYSVIESLHRISLKRIKKSNELNIPLNNFATTIEHFKEQWTLWNQNWLNIKDNIPESRRIDIVYEQFIKNPLRIIEQLEHFLAVDFLTEKITLDNLSTINPYHVNKWQESPIGDILKNSDNSSDLIKICILYGFDI